MISSKERLKEAIENFVEFHMDQETMQEYACERMLKFYLEEATAEETKHLIELSG